MPELLIALLDRSLAGTLVLQEPSGDKHAVLIVRGAPGKARLANNTIFLGSVFVELGIITREVCDETRARAQKAQMPHGQVLVAEGHIDDTGLFVGLREQLRRQILALCKTLPADTAFGLYDADYLEKWGPSRQWRVKPLPLIWRALVDESRRERVDQIVGSLGQHPLRMRLEAPVNRYHMDRSELGAINVLRAKPMSVHDLIGSGVGKPEGIARIVYALTVTRQLALRDDLPEPVGHDEPPESPHSVMPPRQRPGGRASTGPRVSPRPFRRPSPPPEPADGTKRNPRDLEGFRKEVAACAEKENETLYELLGVEADASAAQVRTAFFQLAKRWHPDKLAPELEDLRDVVTRTFAKMSEAHQILSDEGQRKQYDQALEGGNEEQQEVARVLLAASAFQRAEVLLKKRSYAQALAEARTAYEGDQTQAEYQGLYAWLLHLTGQEEAEPLVKMLDEAVKAEPENVRLLWYRGQLLKKAGLEAKAIRDFKRIVSMKPNHVDAAREVRVHDMRRRTGEGKSGLFGKWRGKR